MSDISNINLDIRTTGQHRELLIACLGLAVRGQLSNLQTKGIIGCSNQINQSLSAEIRMRQAVLKSGQRPVGFGNLELGAHGRFIEGAETDSQSPAAPPSACADHAGRSLDNPAAATLVDTPAAPSTPARTGKAKKPSVSTKINAAKKKKR